MYIYIYVYAEPFVFGTIKRGYINNYYFSIVVVNKRKC